MTEYGQLLRITFIIHIIIGLVFGIGFLLVPELLYPIFELTFADPNVRTFGAMIIALTIGSILSLMAKDWEQVKIVVEIELVFTLLGPIAMIYHMFVPPTPGVMMWGPIAILLITWVLFLISYLQEKKK
jgi:hypothetical protein